jgi:uroporphyrinogen III methyltransferase / synthase
MVNRRGRVNGKVYLVGAGPGDPGLLTLKGKAALEAADSVIYDFLANPALLRLARRGSEKLCVGKHAGRSTVPQEKINRLLICKARSGKTVVRLKGGDPFIFGRGGEEALALATAGIPFEIVPGVTSGHAAPAYAGIPVTHRGLASSVTFVTGREGTTTRSRLQWKKIATASDTLVLFMGVRKLAEITQTLIRHGRPASTPVAVIRWGSRADQRVITGTLANVASRAKGIEPPALAVIGPVVRLRKAIQWFENKPLFGRRIVVTRAREQAGELTKLLEDLGAEVIELPVIEIQDPPSWEKLDREIRNVGKFDYLMFTSANGVRKFLGRLAAAGRDLRALHGLQIGAIGPGTAAELARRGIKADFVPREYRAEGLIEVLATQVIRGKSFLIPRAKVARDLLPQALRARGARVTVVEAYRTAVPKLSVADRRNVLASQPDGTTFTSSSTVRNLLKLLGPGQAKRVKQIPLFSLGPVTSETIRTAGLRVAAEARQSTMAGLAEAIRIYFTKAR